METFRGFESHLIRLYCAMAEMVEAIGFDPMNLWVRLLLAQLIFFIMKKSLIINLYGGPGSGKSTCAAYIFSQLKMHNINAELITEQTKAEAYKQNTEFFENQFYIDGCASYQIKQLFGNVDVIITDSPFRMNYLYALDHNKPKLAEAILEDLEQYNQYSKNYFINRPEYFQREGRVHNEEQSKEIDNRIKNMLRDQYVNFIEIENTELDEVVKQLLETSLQNKI